MTPSISLSPSQSCWRSRRPAFVKQPQRPPAAVRAAIERCAGSQLGERGEIIHRGGRPDDSLVVLRPGLQPLGHRVGRGLKLGNIQLFEPLSLTVEHANVRPIKLVRRARQEVAAPFVHVDELVRREVHGIDKRERSASRAMATARATSLIVPSALDAAPIASSRVAVVGQAAVQVVPVELAGFRDHPDLKDGDTPLALERPPWIDVGVMVQLGDDDRIAGPEPPPKGPCQVKRQRRHVEPEGDLGGRRVEEVGHGLPRMESAASVSALVGKAPVRVRIVVNQIIGHGLDHDAREPVSRPARRSRRHDRP